MQEPVSGSYRWTEDEFAEANEDCRKHRDTRRQRTGQKIFYLVLLIIYYIWIYYLLKGKSRHLLALLMTLLTLAVWVVVNSRRARRSDIRREFDKILGGLRHVRWSASGEGLAIWTDLSEVRLDWGLIHRVVETDRGFLVFQTESSFFWFPKHAFSQVDGVARFRLLCEENGLLATVHSRLVTFEGR